MKGKWKARYTFMDDWFQVISEKYLTQCNKKCNKIYLYESSISIYFQRIALKQIGPLLFGLNNFCEKAVFTELFKLNLD